MNSAIDGTDTGSTASWLERARMQGVAQDAAEVQRIGDWTAGQVPRDDGWDPYDIWLRRVHLPRLRGKAIA